MCIYILIILWHCYMTKHSFYENHINSHLKWITLSVIPPVIFFLNFIKHNSSQIWVLEFPGILFLSNNENSIMKDWQVWAVCRSECLISVVLLRFFCLFLLFFFCLFLLTYLIQGFKRFCRSTHRTFLIAKYHHSDLALWGNM